MNHYNGDANDVASRDDYYSSLRAKKVCFYEEEKKEKHFNVVKIHIQRY